MLAGYPKTDLLALQQVCAGGVLGYWDENDNYAVAPFGELPPYYEGYKRYGYEYNIGGGSTWANPFGEGAVAGTPGTLPTGWEKIEALGITGRVQYVGTLAEAKKLSIEFSGVASGTGTGYQLNFGPFSTPASLPAAAAGGNWCYNIHLVDYSGMTQTGITVVMGVQPFDASNALLTAATQTITNMPVFPVNMRHGRFSARTGNFPANTARACMFLRVNVQSGVDMSGRRLWLAMPNGSLRGSPGYLPGWHSAAATAQGQSQSATLQTEVSNMYRWLNHDEGTFYMRFKPFPPPTGNGHTRGIFGFGNYVSSIFGQMSTIAPRPNLQVSSNWPAGTFTRTLATQINTNVWHRLAVSYKRYPGSAVIRTCWTEEGITAFPTINVDTIAELVPMLFGTIGTNGSTFRTTRNPLNGAMHIFDYYPFELNDTLMRALVTVTPTY